jgi:hypothetical protein
MKAVRLPGSRGIRKSTMQPVIVAKVIDRQKNSIVDIKSFR